MSHREDLARLLSVQPFLPLRVLMANGDAVVAPHPDMLMPTLGWIELSDPAADTVTLLNFSQVVSIEQLPSTPEPPSFQ